MSGLNDVPLGERIHIGFFGRRNAGKSSVVNAVTGQDLSVVSEYAGTTTDPVMKSMELLPLGPVVIIDTPGFDDEGHLGELRVQRTKKVLNKTDIAVLVVDGTEGMKECDAELLSLFRDKGIPHITVFNKSDIASEHTAITKKTINVSALTGEGISELKSMLGELSRKGTNKHLIGDKVHDGDVVILVVPIDEAAPKGRLILPQQQVLRDLLDNNAIAVVTKDTELKMTLDKLGRKPDLVITDSQVFGKVSRILPADVKLTSFSILMARYKGLLDEAVKSVTYLDKLQDGDTILIAEGCTHHRQCGDIGTVKIPKWITEHTGKHFEFKTVSGTEFPDDLTPYDFVVHCGGCMLSEREVTYRTKCAVDQNVPMTNYGILIAYINGILKRSVGIFPDLEKLL